MGFLIDAGVVAATLSSAMASFLGAPRILQSTAKDRIFPFLAFFAVGTGPSDNPRRGVLLCTGIALGTIALGNLNLVARVVSMFFLISYGLLNYATYYEARSRSPSFRPRFRWFHARLSLLGGLVCLASMLALDVAAGLTAIAVLAAIHQYLRRTAGPARWADSRRSYHLQQVREHLLAAAAETQHPRDWRPNLLAFSNDPDRRRPLLRFGSWIEGGSGLTTAVRVIEGEGVRVLRERAAVEEQLNQDLLEGGFQAFPLAVAAPSLEVGIQVLVQACGAGPLRANTALLNWLEERPDPEAGKRYGRNLRATFRLGLNLVILDAKPEEWDALETREPHGRRIDVWWQDDATSRLMLLLAYLITRSEDWDGAAIRVLAAAGDQGEEGRLETLRQTLDEARIEGDPVVTAPWTPGLVAEHSGDSSLVFLPLRLRGEDLLGPSGEPVDAFLEGLPIVALVIAAHDIDLGAEPEDGVAGERAAALDALRAAREKARVAGAAAARAAADAEGNLRAMRTAVASGLDEETVARLEAETLEALEGSRKAARREARAVAKAEEAAREAAVLGVRLEEDAATAPGVSEEPGEQVSSPGETGGKSS